MLARCGLPDSLIQKILDIKHYDIGIIRTGVYIYTRNANLYNDRYARS